ncbi:adenosylmethionine--8-amino-7-oxononanoate transaminase [Rhodoferax sp.]|uniref:adenosylmethionine--8-amino-7-oxononanoate transaminase n=1 Tax=Rhodoferax sp. TaxID=50421 RepID=UPI0025F782D3|nr:adenosylmethionine--8-amino-7-oxononanoate transaminase [Rhodoferax sp.]MCM2297747.1 adenosylmethionine--8-amino-7-oxononanoate transaminase [Rhodoferax sp.]
MSASLSSRSTASVWHPCTQMKRHETQPPLALVRGSGAWLYDEAGKGYLDGLSSWWVNLFGHANPRINAAVKAQLDTLEHVMLAGCTHAPVVELSERLAALTGHALGHCFYASDGASAVEIALKMSAHYWRNSGQPRKRDFACLAQSYHGETLGALGVTDVPLFRQAYDGLLRPAHIVASPDARAARPGESARDVAARAAETLRQLFEAKADTIAALIVEPLVQCAAGMAMHDAQYLQDIRRLCDQYHVHLIADEIAVGCGRTGTFFACEQAGNWEGEGERMWPDFLCLSKGISGGYLPLSLVMTTPNVYQAFYDDGINRAFLHSHSYTGNPLACRAALACLDIFEEDDVLNANRVRARRLSTLLAPLAAHPQVRHFRQQGMIWAFDVTVEDPAQAATFSRRFHALALERGLMLRPIGKTVYLMPPYILNDHEQALLAEGVQSALDEALRT